MRIAAMPARRRLSTILLALGALTATAGCGDGESNGEDKPPQDERPNVVVIMTDDQRADLVEFMPTVMSRIAGEGLLFENSFATTPLCCPSRASFLTGQYAGHHGVLTNDPPDGGYERFDDSSTLATWLHDAGYNTAMIGKYLNGYGQALRDGNETIPPGWDEWFAFEVGYERFLLNDNGSIAQFSDSYSTDVLRDHAVTFVEDALSGGPFFLYFNTFAPHFRARPAARHEGTCEGIPVLRPPSFNEQDISDKPGWMQQLPFASDVEIRASDVFRSDQICTLKAVDEAVAAILDALGPELDNTLVIFTSDNGLMLLEHRLQFKNCIYEECIRVPLAVRYPPLGHGTSEELALNIDLAPTILEAAGLSIPESVDGQSLFALDRDDFLIEVFGPTRPPAIAVRTTRYKYAELATGDVELYDLQSDRYELTNLANDPASAALRTDLAARLAELELP